MKEVGKRLKDLRECIGISQEKLAEAIGSTQSSVNRYENGQSTPPVDIFRRYADYFRCVAGLYLCPYGQTAGCDIRVQAKVHTGERGNAAFY